MLIPCVIMNMERGVSIFWEKAVDIREVADYFLEAHALMIMAAFVLHVPGTRQVIRCAFVMLESQAQCRQNSRGHFTVSTTLALYAAPSC